VATFLWALAAATVRTTQIPFPARWDQRGLEECTSASINTPVKFANGT
jgi:hypothetical protein